MPIQSWAQLTPGGGGLQSLPINGGLLDNGPGTAPVAPVVPGAPVIPGAPGIPGGPVVPGRPGVLPPGGLVGVNPIVNPILNPGNAPVTIAVLDKSMVPGISCPLVDGQGHKDILAAANNLHSNLATLIYDCTKNANNQSTVGNPYSATTQEIANSAAVLKKYIGNPGLIATSPTFMQEVEDNLQLVMRDVVKVTTQVSSNNQFVSQSCPIRSKGNMIAAVADLIQSVTPIALSVMQANPQLAASMPEAVPFIMGTSAVASLIHAMNTARANNTINTADPLVRKAVLQNVCEYGRIIDRLNEFRQSARARVNLQKATHAIVNQRQAFVSHGGNTAVVQSRFQSMTMESQRREVLDEVAVSEGGSFVETINADNSVFNDVEIDRSLREIEMALFTKPGKANVFGAEVPWINGQAPVFSWFMAEADQMKTNRSDFSQEMKFLRDEALNHYVNPLALSQCSNTESLEQNGRIQANCGGGANRAQAQHVVDSINNLTVFNAQKFPAGSVSNTNLCNRLNMALNDWQKTLNSMGAMMLYCSYLKKYMKPNFDPTVIQACVGDQDFSGHQYGSNGLTSLRDAPQTRVSETDVQLVFKKMAELKCQ
jgi:hypothetical protein